MCPSVSLESYKNTPHLFTALVTLAMPLCLFALTTIFNIKSLKVHLFLALSSYALEPSDRWKNYIPLHCIIIHFEWAFCKPASVLSYWIILAACQRLTFLLVAFLILLYLICFYRCLFLHLSFHSPLSSIFVIQFLMSRYIFLFLRLLSSSFVLHSKSAFKSWHCTILPVICLADAFIQGLYFYNHISH